MVVMSLHVARTANFSQHAQRTWAANSVRRPAAVQPVTGEVPAIRVQQLGYVGLEQAVAPYQGDFRPGSPALLTALIHSMGGAVTSVASGLYLNSRV